MHKSKLHVRRLPPALKEADFLAAIGDGFQYTYFRYVQGKAPVTGSAWLKLADDAAVARFEARFLEIAFPKAAAQPLKPTLEYAACQRLPGRDKTDHRAGTLDRDVEFMAFLEEQTLPVAKPAAIETTATAPVTTTPLIQHLREMKKNKRAKTESKKKKADLRVDPLPRQRATATKPAPTKAYLRRVSSLSPAVLTTALSSFGPVVKVDVDRRKGTAVAEFAASSGLRAAVAQKSVTVGQSVVEIAEYRDKPAPRQGQKPGEGEKPVDRRPTTDKPKPAGREKATPRDKPMSTRNSTNAGNNTGGPTNTGNNAGGPTNTGNNAGGPTNTANSNPRRNNARGRGRGRAASAKTTPAT